jgi:hypothetical protein
LEPKAQYEEERQQDDSAAAGTEPWEFLGLAPAPCSILLCFCAQGCLTS